MGVGIDVPGPASGPPVLCTSEGLQVPLIRTSTIAQRGTLVPGGTRLGNELGGVLNCYTVGIVIRPTKVRYINTWIWGKDSDGNRTKSIPILGMRHMH